MFYSYCLCYCIYVIITFSQHCICIVFMLLKVGDVMLQQLQIGYSIVNQCYIHVYYDVVNLL
jgi:hypothetical protein